MPYLHELVIDTPEVFDFESRRDLAVIDLWRLIREATIQMNRLEPEDDNIVFVRVPIGAE